jgi:hypothetical protein
MDCANRDPVAEIGRYAPAAGLQTASLDEVLSHTLSDAVVTRGRFACLAVTGR